MKIQKRDVDFYIELAKILSSPYEEQYAQLYMLNDYLTHDIASDWIWENLKNGIIQMSDQYLLDDKVIDLYKEIDKSFHDVSLDGSLHDEGFWTLNGLKNHPIWEAQRERAQKIISILEKIECPIYVPKRLQKNFRTKEEKYGANIIVKGVLCCCEQESFYIRYLGDIQPFWFFQKTIIHKEDALMLLAKCNKCGKEIVVFDSLTDGYDRCVEDTISSLPSPEFKDFPCSKCSKGCFSVELSFEYQEKEELEEVGVSDYENAFSWIWVTLTCSFCKKRFKNLVDVETS